MGGHSGLRQQLMEEFQEQSAHYHNAPSINMTWAKSSCLLSLAKNKETVTESIVTVVLNTSMSGVLFSIQVLFNMENSFILDSLFSTLLSSVWEHLPSVSCLPIGLLSCFGQAHVLHKWNKSKLLNPYLSVFILLS